MDELRIPNRVERYHTVVIGAGQAGLAAGYELQQRDEDFIILDGASRVGETWRRRWDSLRLFTPAAYNNLPGMPFPADPSSFPSKDDVADYLERYAAEFELPIRLKTHVRSLSWSHGRYIIETESVRYEAMNVVVAAGPFQAPRVPAMAADLSPIVYQVHSHEYVNQDQLPEGSVLVVGVGNSGAQIAMELGRHRKVWLAGSEVGRLPRRCLGRDLYDWSWPVLSKFTTKTSIGRALRYRYRFGDPLIGIGNRHFNEAGVERIGRVTGIEDRMPVADGRTIPADVVIWATGYAPDFRWIKLPIFDENGSPRHEHGVVRTSPGLYFVGLRFQSGYPSSLLGGVGRDAGYVAEQVAGRIRAAA